MSKLDALGDLVGRLSNDFGKAMTLKEHTGSEYDPDTGTTVDTYNDHSVSGIVRSFRQDLMDGSAVQVGDLDVHVPASQIDFLPDTNDVLVMDGTEWSIVYARRIYTGESVGFFRLQVR
jgi:hypothetical protein